MRPNGIEVKGRPIERLILVVGSQNVLIIYGEWRAGRTYVVLVREPVGI